MKLRRMLAMLLALTLVISCVPAFAMAAGTNHCGQLAYAADQWTHETTEDGVGYYSLRVTYVDKPTYGTLPEESDGNPPALGVPSTPAGPAKLGDVQQLVLYVPEAYVTENRDGTVSLNPDGKVTSSTGFVYTTENAPMIYQNTSAGYSASSIEKVESDFIKEGYIHVSIQTRGKATQDENGQYIGQFPAVVVDLKAGVRFLKYYDDVLPGSSARIVSRGASSGGAVSAMLGATGNSPLFDSYLKEIGAKNATDDIFIVLSYCPITNLSTADAAYEWYQYGNDTYWLFSAMAVDREGNNISDIFPTGPFNKYPLGSNVLGGQHEDELSQWLFNWYVDYVQGLGFDLGDDGVSGDYYTGLVDLYADSLATFLDRYDEVKETLASTNPFTGAYTPAPATVQEYLSTKLKGNWYTYDQASGKVTISSLSDVMKNVVGRNKMCPSLDSYNYKSNESNAFVQADGTVIHFSPVVQEGLQTVRDSYEWTGKDAEYLDLLIGDYETVTDENASILELMSPINYVKGAVNGEYKSDIAPYFRWQIGGADGDHGLPAAWLTHNALLKYHPEVSSEISIIWAQGHGDVEYTLQDMYDYIADVVAENEPVNPSTITVPWVISGSNAFSCNGGAACPSYPFKDVDTSKWYHEPIDFVVERDLMNGMSSTTFAPNASLTRGMLVTILYRYEGEPAVSGQNPFTDVPAGQYYTNAVKWAAAHDIVKGITTTTFQPNTNVTREQMVTILYRYAQYKGVSVRSQSALNEFYDAASVSSYARDAFGWAVYEGIIQGDNYNLRPKSTATRAEVAAVLQRYIQNVIEGNGGAAVIGIEEIETPVPETPTLTVEKNTIFGQADTGGKTSLKNTLLTASGPGDQRIAHSDPVTGERIYYPTDAVIDQPGVQYTGQAVIQLTGKNVDSSLIDTSNAKVELVAGDGYYPKELILDDSKVSAVWKNGTLTYSLHEGALEWNTGDYNLIDPNSGREWSVLGGDGNGVYTFNFQLSGVRYNGKKVDPVTFQVKVYIWGRTGTDLAPTIIDLVPAESESGSGKTQSNEIQWTWVGDAAGNFLGAAAKPILADAKQDDFFITWPAGTDASGLTANDVTVTLYTQYGESYVLKSAGEHVQYAVFSNEGETQVAVTFRHAAFVPVFNTMTIEVDGQGLSASKTYDIASVYTYMVQQGGGGLTVDGTVTAYSYYGYEGLSIANAVQATYTLSYKDENGTTWYYNQEGGVSQAVEKTVPGFGGQMQTSLVAPDDAVVYDAMGEDDCDVQFIVNTLYVKTRLGKTETINGQVFTKNYTSGQIGNWNGVSVAPGYVVASGFSPNQQWAWSTYYGSGWSPELYVVPTTIPYTHDGVFGDWADRYVTYYSCKAGTATLYLGVRDDGWFFLTGVPGEGALTGTGVLEEKTQGWGPTAKKVTTLTLDDATRQILDKAGIAPWYSYAVLTKGGMSNSFSFTTNVSEALITDQSAYTIVTEKNEDSATGYTTTITVKDNGYENVYAYGDWVSVDAEGNQHEPEEWENGFEYATSSVRKMEKNASGDWELKLDLASSVMGVIAYHDVWEEHLVALFPQKISFYVPYDAEKQSDSTDWTPAFPASVTGVDAGEIAYTTTDDGLSVAVYTPYGYDAEAEGGYPVIYLIPGGGSTFKSWFTDGMVGNIFDNLTASGDAKATIVVSMQREDVNAGKLDAIIAWVEANYNVSEDRALGGVSMGSVAATQLWQASPSQFGWYAFLSGGDPAIRGAYQDAENYVYAELDSAKLAAMKKASYFLGGGTTDFNMFVSNPDSASITDLDAWMTHYGIGHNLEGNGQYDVTVGDHNWPIWMKLMIPFVTDYLWK